MRFSLDYLLSSCRAADWRFVLQRGASSWVKNSTFKCVTCHTNFISLHQIAICILSFTLVHQHTKDTSKKLIKDRRSKLKSFVHNIAARCKHMCLLFIQNGVCVKIKKCMLASLGQSKFLKAIAQLLYKGRWDTLVFKTSCRNTCNSTKVWKSNPTLLTIAHASTILVSEPSSQPN